MADDSPRPRLGRGLAALLGEHPDEVESLDRARGARRVPIEFLHASKNNPRRVFQAESLQELAASIRTRGLIQPIIVRSAGKPDSYEIIAGERRWRAAQQAGLRDVPIVLVTATDRDALEIAIVENIQRADLNPLEEASGYQQLVEKFKYSQQDLSALLGKSRSHIANTLRLLRLPETVKSYVDSGQISAGHARALLAVREPDSVAERIVEEGLTVRDVERLGRAGNNLSTKSAIRENQGKDPDTAALEKALSSAVGLSVSIKHSPSGGVLSIRYKTLEQLESICTTLNSHM